MTTNKPKTSSEAIENLFNIFTLSGIIIGLAFTIVIGGILVIILNGFLYNPLVISHNATGQAKQYVEQINKSINEPGRFKFVGCSSDDHERDGYATCTIMDNTVKQGKIVPEPISCTYKFFSTGCKPWTPKAGTVGLPQ